MSRDDAFQMINEYSLETTLGFTALITAFYAYYTNFDVDTNSNQIIGIFVSVVLNGIMASASLIAFAVLLIAAPAKWGEVADLRTYIGIGSLIGLISSVISLASLFRAT